MTEEIKILEHLKDYLQMLLDSGTHKIFYNDLMFDEKTVDCINAITNLQKENEELLKKLEDVSLDEANIRADILLEQQDYKQRNEKAIEYIKTQEVDFVDVHYQQQDDYFEKLLNILQGGDE